MSRTLSNETLEFGAVLAYLRPRRLRSSRRLTLGEVVGELRILGVKLFVGFGLDLGEECLVVGIPGGLGFGVEDGFGRPFECAATVGLSVELLLHRVDLRVSEMRKR